MVRKLVSVMLLAAIIAMGGVSVGEEVRYAYVNTQDGGLHFRWEPNRDSASEYTLERGEKVELLSVEDGWAKCNVWGDVLYCKADYISETPPDDQSIGTYVVVSDGRVRVRSEASSGGKAVGWVKPEQAVEVLGWLNGYAKIESGFVNADFLKGVTE